MQIGSYTVNGRMVIAIGVAILTAGATGTVALPLGIPQEWGAYIQSWDNFLLKIYSIVIPIVMAYMPGTAPPK